MHSHRWNYTCSSIPYIILYWNNITHRTGSVINQTEDTTQDSISDTSSKSRNYLLRCFSFSLGDRKLCNILPHVSKLISLSLVIKHSDALWGCICCSISAAKFSTGSCGCDLPSESNQWSISIFICLQMWLLMKLLTDDSHTSVGIPVSPKYGSQKEEVVSMWILLNITQTLKSGKKIHFYPVFFTLSNLIKKA